MLLLVANFHQPVKYYRPVGRNMGGIDGIFVYKITGNPSPKSPAGLETGSEVGQSNAREIRPRGLPA